MSDMMDRAEIQWLRMDSALVTGKIGMSRNTYGTPVSVHVCESCHLIFTVCPEVDDSWGKGCMGIECDTYDVERDVDLIFEIEPWKIRRDGKPLAAAGTEEQ